MTVFDALASEPLLLTLALVTCALCIGAIVAPRRSLRARNSNNAAGVSPLWLLLFCVGFVVALFGLHPGPRREGVALAILLAQLGLSAWVIYRHRRWAWIAVSLALVLLLWSAAAVAVFVATGVWGTVSH